MKQLIEKYPVTAFYVICLFAAILFGLTNMVLFPKTVNYMLLLPQFAPAIAAILVVVVKHGKVGICNLLQTATLKKSSLKWSLIAIIIPVVVCGLSYVAFCLIEDNEFTYPEFERPLWNYALCLLFAILGSYGEEIGWRGFMLPQLQKKHSLFISSLIVGLCWGLWHMKFQSGIEVFALYTFLVVEFSITISWLWSKTKGNIITAILFHTSVNMCSLLFFERIITNSTDKHMQILLYGIYAVIFAIPCLFTIRSMIISK